MPGAPVQQADDAARSLLRRRGLRATAERLRVLRTLAAADGHLSAADVRERIEASGGGVDLSTVYRTVTTLQEHGVVHALARPDQPVTYGIAIRPHHHAVCRSCHRVIEVPAADLEAAVGLAQDATGFTFAAESLQLPGLCADCRGRAD